MRVSTLVLNLVLILILSLFLGGSAGFLVSTSLIFPLQKEVQSLEKEISDLKQAIFDSPFPADKNPGSPIYFPQTNQEQLVIKAVNSALPSVVSIQIIERVPVYEEFGEIFKFFIPIPGKTEKKKVGGGTGFIVSEDGLVVTNKHVVASSGAEYKAVMQDGKEYPVEVLAKDPFQDLAVLKIKAKGRKFKPLKLGDSNKIQVGQTVIAIGYALGEFSNTVSVGVVSGLGRKIVAQGGGMVEAIENLIQTDAAINPGNSGGPLLNLQGEVIGVNTAKAQAENIGFAIPINEVKKVLAKIEKYGKIVYPFLGVCWTLVDERIREALNLDFDYGAIILSGRNCPYAVVPGSPAEKAGLKEGDIILELDGEKITKDNSLAKIISKKQPYQKVNLKVWSQGKIRAIDVVLGERSS